MYFEARIHLLRDRWIHSRFTMKTKKQSPEHPAAMVDIKVHQICKNRMFMILLFVTFMNLSKAKKMVEKLIDDEKSLPHWEDAQKSILCYSTEVTTHCCKTHLNSEEWTNSPIALFGNAYIQKLMSTHSRLHCKQMQK